MKIDEIMWNQYALLCLIDVYVMYVDWVWLLCVEYVSYAVLGDIWGRVRGNGSAVSAEF